MAKKQNFVTCRAFYKYMCMMRDTGQISFQHFSKLWQQFLVDQYIKVETNELNYLKFQKGKELMSAYYDGLMDAVANDTIQFEDKPTILPPSFKPGPRAYHARFQDAM